MSTTMPAKKQLLLFVLLCVIAACAGNQDKVGSMAVAVRNDSIMLANGYDVVPMFKTKTGHITVTLQVNGRPCVFLIDTGGGATLIDLSKKDKYDLKVFGTKDYAAGIGSVSRLVRTSAMLQVNDHEEKTDSLYLMDISYTNTEFKRNRSRTVDGILGSDFLDSHHAIIDYANSKIYLRFE